MIKCIVIDDEPLAVKLISNYVNDHAELELVASYHDPIKALHEFDDKEIHLIFLDIQMPQLSGIQFLKILNNRAPVILTTAYNEYALESYDYNVIDYLIKPISFDRFSKSIDKFKVYNHLEKTKTQSQSNQVETSESIFIKSGHRTVRVELKNIKFLESKGDYLFITTNSEIIKTLENLKDILQRLNTKFLRCHRSFIVNMHNIDFIENNRIVIGDDYIPISRAYVEAVHSYVKNRSN